MESLIYLHISHAAWYGQPFNYFTANFRLATRYISQVYSLCLKGNPLEDNKVYAKKIMALVWVICLPCEPGPSEVIQVFCCLTGSLGHLGSQLCCGLCAFDSKTHPFLTTGIYSLNYWFIASSTPSSHSLGYVLEKPNAQTICLQLKYFSVGLSNPIVEGNWVESELSQTSQIRHHFLMAPWSLSKG